jgi:hypothetical protein
MRDVWDRLFSVPFDSSLFDFGSTVVILVGAGRSSSDGAGFGIDAVERVVAKYTDSSQESFISIQATTFLPGALPGPLLEGGPPLVAAVKLTDQRSPIL